MIFFHNFSVFPWILNFKSKDHEASGVFFNNNWRKAKLILFNRPEIALWYKMSHIKCVFFFFSAGKSRNDKLTKPLLYHFILEFINQEGCGVDEKVSIQKMFSCFHYCRAQCSFRLVLKKADFGQDCVDMEFSKDLDNHLDPLFL